MSPITVLSPIPEAAPAQAVQALRTAPPRQIALVNNLKINAGRLMNDLAALLAAEDGVRVECLKKPSASEPMPEERLQALAREYDAVVVGIGD